MYTNYDFVMTLTCFMARPLHFNLGKFSRKISFGVEKLHGISIQAENLHNNLQINNW